MNSTLGPFGDFVAILFLIVLLIGAAFGIAAMIFMFFEGRSKRGKAVKKTVALCEKLHAAQRALDSADYHLQSPIKSIRKATGNELSDYTKDGLLEGWDELHGRITAMTNLIDELNETVKDLS